MIDNTNTNNNNNNDNNDNNNIKIKHHRLMEGSQINPALTDTRSVEAMNEFADSEHLSVFCSMAEIKKNFHKGVVVYFMFCQFIIFTNFVLFLCALISYIPFMSRKDNNVEFSNSVYVDTYTHHETDWWRASSIIAIILSFAFVPMWHYYSTFETANEIDFDDSHEDIRESVRNVPKNERRVRRVFSVAMFCAVLCVSLAVAYAFAEAQWAVEHSTDENKILAFSFVVSAAISFTNMALQSVARFLTEFEKRSTWTAVRNSNALKLTSLKILNVWMFMLAKFLVQRRERKDSSTERNCYLGVVGRQYFALIVLELTVANAIEVLLPIVYARLFRKYGGVGDIQSKADFDVSTEFLELIYRQYVVYVAFNSFPLVAGLAVITNVVELFLDRYRLFNLLRARGNVRVRRMSQVLSFFLAFVAVAALLSFPSGSAFTIGANQSQHDGFWTNCHVLPVN